MKVCVNGKEEILNEGVTVADLVEAHGLDPHSIIIEHNRELLEKRSWPGVALKENDRLEILRLVGGG